MFKDCSHSNLPKLLIRFISFSNVFLTRPYNRSFSSSIFIFQFFHFFVEQFLFLSRIFLHFQFVFIISSFQLLTFYNGFFSRLSIFFSSLADFDSSIVIQFFGLVPYFFLLHAASKRFMQHRNFKDESSHKGHGSSRITSARTLTFTISFH